MTMEQPIKVAKSDNSRPFVFVLAFAIVLLLAGLLVLWMRQSDNLPREGDPAVLFARDMIAHHAQAIEMALLIRERSSNEELRQFALDIILTQQAQLGQMQGWLAVWGVPLAGREPPMQGHGHMMGMASQEDVNSLSTLPIAEAEPLFLQLMIRHHQGGVTMAEEVLAQTERPEVQRLAKAIIQAQQNEIKYMNDLLERIGE
jgi:uncharacterized protein (DUF305 family)